MATHEDEENPPLSRGFWIFKDPEPGFTTLCVSMTTNFILSNMLIYGLTGRGKLAYLTSLATIPASLFFCLKDSQKDYDKWKEMKLMRMKGLPDRFMPYKCKYDWTDYDKAQVKRDLKRMERQS